MNESIINNNIGQIKIADNVAETIASIAAQEVKGVIRVKDSLISPISEMFGKKKFSQGVKISTQEEITTIELSLVIKHGVNIINLAENVQNNVKEAVEAQAGIIVNEVNVIISDIVFEEKKINQARSN